MVGGEHWWLGVGLWLGGMMVGGGWFGRGGCWDELEVGGSWWWGGWLLGWLLVGECGPGNWGGWWLGEGTPVPGYHRYATLGRNRGREDGKIVKYQKQICPLSTIVLEFTLHQQYWTV